MDLHGAQRIGTGRTAEIYAWGEGRALKLYHAWVPEPWIAHEQRGTAAAQRAGLPAPAVLGTEMIEGRRGIVLDRVDGPSLRQAIAGKPWRAIWMAQVLAEVHAALHARPVAPDGMPTLRTLLLDGIRGSGLAAEVRDRAEAALARLPDGDVLCHYDLHPENVILTRRGPVVIDWMAAAVGHPLADVARTLLLLRLGGGPRGTESFTRRMLSRVYLRRYLRRTHALPAALREWELPVAVARAAERIEVERPALEAWLTRLAA